MLNSTLVRDQFGQYYKIQTHRDKPAPAALKAESFHSNDHASRFMQNLSIPVGFWERIYDTAGIKHHINSNLNIEIAQLLRRNQIKVYKVDNPSLTTALQDQREVKHIDNKSYIFEPSSVLLSGNSREIKSFSNEKEATKFLSELQLDDDKLAKIADGIKIQNAKATTKTTDSQEKIFGSIIRALTKGTAIISVKKADSAPPLPSESLEALAILSSDKSSSLGPPVEKIDDQTDEHALVKLYPDKNDYKQYVNLPLNSEDKTHGRYIELEAHLNKPVSGVTIHFKLIEHIKNKENLPNRMQGSGLASSMKEETGDLFATTNSDGIARISVKLSSYGGDQFQAVASLNAECNSEAKENVTSTWITVWRKLWFQLTHHDDLSPPSMESSITQFKKVFIDFSSEAAVTHTKAANGDVIVGTHNAPEYHALHNDLHPGQSVHIILCDKQVDGTPGKVVEIEAEFTQDSNFIHATAGGTYIMFDPPLSGGSLLVSGIWENASLGKSGTLTGDIANATKNIGLCTYNNENFVEIKLPENANPSTEEPVKVSILVTVASGPWGGDGGTEPHNLIVIDPDDTIHTMCVMHELGHLINLGPMEYSTNCPDGFEYSDHPNLYASNGAHCYSGGALIDNANGEQIGSGGTCIMYHQLNTSCSLEFCEYCAPFVKGMTLKKFKDLKK